MSCIHLNQKKSQLYSETMGPSTRQHPAMPSQRCEKYIITTTSSRRGCASQYGVGYTTAAAGFNLFVMALISSRAEGSVFDTPAEDLEEDDYMDYGTEVGIATAGLGIGLSLVFGVSSFIAMLAMCCRCKRMHREDLAIAQAERNTGAANKGLEDMYEVEDYEDKIAAQRKKLWILTLSLFLGYLFCAIYAYNGAKTADAAFNNIFDGTDTLLTRLQIALCAENGAKDCANQSVGDFLLDTITVLTDLFENIIELLTSLSVVVTPLYWVSANLTTAGMVINGTGTAVLNINASIPIVNHILTGNGSVADLTDGIAIPTLDASIFEDLEEGKTALANASELMNDYIIDVMEQLSGSTSTLTRVQYQVDDIEGNEIGEDEDVRNSTLEEVYENLEYMRDTTKDIYEFQNEDLVDAREFTNNYVEISVQVVAGIIFLPGVILLLTAICSGMCQSSKPLYLNMCIIFLSQILFCVVAGVFLAVAKINGDFCDRHLDFIEANIKESNMTAQDTVITLDYDKVYLIMTCNGENGDTPTSTNNFIGILEANQAFNMSTHLKIVSSILTNNTNLLNSPKTTVKDAQDEVLSPLDDFVDMAVGDDIDAELDEINDIFNEMPPSPFDWDSRADQDAMDNFYLYNVSKFSWNNETTGDVTYRSQLEAVNKIIGQMVTGVIGGDGFAYIRDPYNFTQARNLTSATVCAETSNFFPNETDPLKSLHLQITIYTYEDQWDHLCGNVSAFAVTTVEIEELIAKNDKTRLEVEDLSDNLDDIEENLNMIYDYQTQMDLLRNDVNDSLNLLLHSLDDLADDLDDLGADVLALNKYFMAASNYTMCGYIGTFYEDVYLDAMCTDLQGNVESVAGPAVCVVILMFLSFCVQGCYGPSMRTRPSHNIGLELDRAALNATTVEPNLATPHSPTPLVGNSGF